MDTKDWFLVIGPLVGVLIGGVIATIAKLIELGQTAVRDDRRRLLEKLELLHTEVAGYVNLFGQRLLSNHLAALNPKDLAFTEASRQADEKLLAATARISAMIRLFAPEVSTFWSLVAEIGLDYNKRIAQERQKATPKAFEGWSSRVGATCALTLSAIEAKVEKLHLLKIHGESTFSENLTLSMGKFTSSFTSPRRQLEELQIVDAELRKRFEKLSRKTEEDSNGD